MEKIIDILKSRCTKNAESGCWEWTKGKDKDGYGKICLKGRHWRAHRLIFHLLISPIEKGEIICHTCDNPSCINPQHLFKGDPLINMQDKVAKGRLKNQHMGKTHCKRGHEFTKENTKIEKTPIGTDRRICITCYVKKTGPFPCSKQNSLII